MFFVLQYIFCHNLKSLPLFQVSLGIQLFHHLFSAILFGGVFHQTGDDARRPFVNVKFCLSVLVFFLYTHIMTPVLLCKSLDKRSPVFVKYFHDLFVLTLFYCAAVSATHLACVHRSKYVSLQSHNSTAVTKSFTNISEFKYLGNL